MAISTVSPYVIMQALQNARLRGAPTDPYGIATALRGIGNDYDAMNRSVVTANAAQNSNAGTNARMDAGYYPALAQSQTAGFNQTTYDLNQHMTMKQAVEEAHKAAAAQGMVAGTPQYELFMRDYLSQHGNYQAALGAVPGANQATKQIQDQAFAKSFMKQAIENELAKQIAVQYVQRNASLGGTPAQNQALALAGQKYARDHMKEQGVEVNQDADGNWSATGLDVNGNQTNLPISPAIQAAGLLATGNNVPSSVMTLMTTQQRQAYDEALKGQIAATNAMKVPAATTAAQAKTAPLAILQAQQKAYLTALQPFLKTKDEDLDAPGRAHRDELIAREKAVEAEIHAQLFPGQTTPGSAVTAPTPDAAAMSMGGIPASVAAPVSTDNSTDYMYGAEPDASTGSGFQDIAPQPPVLPPVANPFGQVL